MKPSTPSSINKNSDPKPKPPAKKKTPWGIFGVAIVLVFVAAFWGWIVLFGKSLLPNYAEDVAKPLETALVEAGAVKKCSQGDNGRGLDNLEPNYGARYQLNMNKDDATKLIHEVSTKNGFTLSRADSPYDSIVRYTDTTSKESGYSDLVGGKTKLVISMYNDTANQALECTDGTALKGDETHTAISLSVVLPSVRQ